MKTLLSISKILILALIIGFGVSYAFAAWQDPTQAPPAGNTPAPINVGTIDQIKEAGLSLDKLAVFGQVVIKDGTEGAGKVLTSDADGLASWQTSTGGAGVVTAVDYCPTVVADGSVACQAAAQNSGSGDGYHRVMVGSVGYSTGLVWNQSGTWFCFATKGSTWMPCKNNSVVVFTFSSINIPNTP